MLDARDLQVSIQKHFADLTTLYEGDRQEPSACECQKCPADRCECDYCGLNDFACSRPQSSEVLGMVYKVNRSVAILSDAIAHCLPPHLFEEFLKIAQIKKDE